MIYPFVSYTLEYASVECTSAAIPFLCLYVYNLCSTSDGVTLLPSSEECLYVKTVACRQEWIEASNLLPNLLPDCDNLPNQTHPISKLIRVVISSISYMLLNFNSNGYST